MSKLGRWRSKRIGLDLDNPSQFTLLKTYFNIKHFFPGTPITIKATAHGFHFRIYKTHTLHENIEVRRALGDDSTRIYIDERRIKVGLEHWVDTLFTAKAVKGKVTREEESDDLFSLPFTSRLPSRKKRR